MANLIKEMNNKLMGGNDISFRKRKEIESES